MTQPAPDYRSVAGLRIPLPLVPRIIAAMRARYPEATAGITDPDRAVRAAIYAWVVETLAEYEAAAALAPLDITIAQTVAAFEDKAKQAKAKAVQDAKSIAEDPDVVPDPEPLPDPPVTPAAEGTSASS